jgi:hypothetical protein
MSLAGVTVPRGTYSLYTLPSRTSWQLIVNKETGQSGLVYHQRLDLARIRLQKRTATDYFERLTISLERSNDRSGILTIGWEKTFLSIPFTLKSN